MSSQKQLFCFLSLMATLCSCEYIYIMLKKFTNMSNISIRHQKENKVFCEDENISFYFLGTKIKI